jgi:hypothetical protein
MSSLQRKVPAVREGNNDVQEGKKRQTPYGQICKRQPRKHQSLNQKKKKKKSEDHPCTTKAIKSFTPHMKNDNFSSPLHQDHFYFLEFVIKSGLLNFSRKTSLACREAY